MGFQRFLLGVAAVLIVSLSAMADLPRKEYEVKKLADSVYGFIWKDLMNNPVEGNSLFVINDEDVLVVDAALFPTTTRLMIDELKKLTSKPVRYVVNTHFHDDHVNGNFVYRENWPGVEFIAHRETRTDIIELVNKARGKDLQGMVETIAMYEGWLDSGKDNTGKILDEARKGRVANALELYKQGIVEYKTVKDAPPDLTFSDSLVLHRGERVIKIMWLGLGNTRGDAIVYLPNEGIAATGDLFVYPIPFGFGSYYKDWITTLARVDSLKADVLFPGHGPEQHDRTYLHQMQDLLRGLVNQVEDAVASGATLDQTQERVTLTELKSIFTHKDEALVRSFNQNFISPAVERMWHQVKGETDTTK